MRAKVAQEALIKGGRVPYTIVRATQFFEFLTAIAGDGADGKAPRVSSALFQPMAADDVAQFLASVVPQDPRNGVVEVGGPERLAMNQAVQRALDAYGDARRVVADAQALYFGSLLNDQSLVTAAVRLARAMWWCKSSASSIRFPIPAPRGGSKRRRPSSARRRSS
jgi:uncharacterized protein YbjT (DUF2867 family)